MMDAMVHAAGGLLWWEVSQPTVARVWREHLDCSRTASNTRGLRLDQDHRADPDSVDTANESMTQDGRYTETRRLPFLHEQHSGTKCCCSACLHTLGAGVRIEFRSDPRRLP
jgi:hypothetical protein